MSTNSEFARYYADLNWSAFCLSPGQKVPLAGSAGFKEATRDQEEIARRWSRHPDANIGIATGAPSGMFVIDIDMKNGKDGLASLRSFIGTDEAETVATMRSLTVSGGVNLFFAYDSARPVGNRANVLPGVDVRGDGGYIVAPPSKVGAGTYRWAPGALDLAAAVAPEWAYRLTTNIVRNEGRASLGSAPERLAWSTVIETPTGRVAVEDAAIDCHIRCCCPFHSDKSPSAFFKRPSYEHGYLHCSACGKTWHTERKVMSAGEAESINARLRYLRQQRKEM
jgi:hypothetical protein